MWERDFYEKCAGEAGMACLGWMQFVDSMVEGLDFEEFFF